MANFILEGLTIKDACFGVGVSDDTFRRWREKYPEFNKKVVDASNHQWNNAAALAKYHSGYRGYKRPKMPFNLGGRDDIRKTEAKPLLEPLKRPQPQFWMGLPIKYQIPRELKPTPKYYNAIRKRVEWVERDSCGICVLHTCQPATYIRKLEKQAWNTKLDSMITVI